MTANSLQLSGLMRANPGHVALYRVQIGADFAITQPAYAHLIGVDVHYDSAAWFILVVSESIDPAAVNLDRVGGCHAG